MLEERKRIEQQAEEARRKAEEYARMDAGFN